MKDTELNGQVVLVTGAAQGIGEAVVWAFAARGATVAAIDRNAERLHETVGQIDGGSGRVWAFAADVSDSAAVNDTVKRIEQELGPIAVVVNVAGVLRISPVELLRDEDWAETFAVNSTGVFHVCRAAANYMKPRRAGSIITIGSNAVGVPRMQMAAYAASKAAATMFTKCLGLELAAFNIRCNIVSPGSTETEMQWSLWNDEHGAAQVIAGSPETYRVGIPLQRLADPADIADAVLFLASSSARHVTMHDLRVDGGATLGV